MKELIKIDWYKSLVEDCKSIITEAIFTSRWALVEGYWKLGERIREEEGLKKWAQNEAGRVLQDLAKDLSISTRTIHYSLQVYDKYPNLDKLPEGKNITWNKLITKYLPAPKEKPTPPLPEGKYNVIVLDPPWAYGTEYDSENRRVASPYKEKSFDEIKEIELPCADDCILWLWTTHKFICDAKKLMEHWGFEYKLILVWDKEKIGMGSWLRCQAEFCLLGIKGKPEWNLTNERDIIRESRREHSRKPKSFYVMVKNLCPDGKRIDYFSREKHDGFEQYGNEINKF